MYFACIVYINTCDLIDGQSVIVHNDSEMAKHNSIQNHTLCALCHAFTADGLYIHMEKV